MPGEKGYRYVYSYGHISDILHKVLDTGRPDNFISNPKIRRSDKTLIMRYIPQNAFYMANESGITDMVDRFFNRF